MWFQSRLSKKTGLFPKAVYALHAAKDVSTHHAIHGFRHPLGIYNVSLTYILTRFGKVLDELDRFSSTYHADKKKTDQLCSALLDTMDHLLDSLLEHMDDCESVIASFFPSKDDPKAKRVWREFKDGIHPYRDHIGRVVNFIKHQQGRLRIVVFSGRSFCYPGYFVEGVVDDGVLGPAPTIHKNSNTAFSFNRDLRFHLVSLYFVSAHLAQAVYEASKIQPQPIEKSEEESRQLLTTLKRVSQLPMFFYPDEISKQIPVVRILDDGVLIEFGGTSVQPQKVPEHSSVEVMYYGDGVSRSFKVPYVL